MPVRIASRYVRAVVDSILDQSFASFGFIVIDDSSTHDTGRGLAFYNERRVTVLEQEGHRGVVVSLNSGIARGVYLPPKDADAFEPGE